MKSPLLLPRLPRLAWMLLLIGGLIWINAARVRDSAQLGLPGQRPPSPQIGFPAPDFALSDLAGQTVRLADLRGQPLVLNFWATWCPPCAQEHPYLVEGARAYAGKVAFYGVLYGDKAASAREFLAKKGAAYPTLVDEDQSTAIDYGVAGVPAVAGAGSSGGGISR